MDQGALAAMGTQTKSFLSAKKKGHHCACIIKYYHVIGEKVALITEDTLGTIWTINHKIYGLGVWVTPDVTFPLDTFFDKPTV